MSPERSQAYRRVMHTLDELGPSKLLEEEQDRIRHAADNLIFASELEPDGLAEAALDDTVRLCRSLVDSGRWEKVTAAQLGNDLRACGPEATASLRAA
ncbi:MAG TPA: hypothetical protein VHW04_18230 [Solirubrobacteraceae bacterium]|nr:hypothetical protein [Solirubrobacteraceae bacterium]